MLIPSKYNIMVNKGSSLCVLNTLTGNIALVDDPVIKRYLCGQEVSDGKDCTDVNQLITDGFIVDECDDEDSIAEVKYLDIVANKELYLVLMPTTACNFRCLYCYENDPGSDDNFKQEIMNSDVQEAVVKYVEKTIKQFFGMFIEWYGGEPLLCMDIIEKMSKQMIDVCQKWGKPYYSTITTNGYLLSEEVFRRCLSCHIYSFHVTLDGFDYIHDKLRFLVSGEGTQSRIIENLRKIRDHVGSQYFKIIIRTNITNELLPHLDEWMAFLEEEFGTDKRFYFFFRPVENRGGTAIKNSEKIILNDKMADAYETMINSNHKLNFGYIKQLMYHSVCGAVKRNHYIIMPNGDVKKCGEYLNNPLSTVGFINPDGYLEVDRVKLAKWIKVKTKTENNQCTSCLNKVSCFNRNCPMRQEVGFNYGYYCGVENKYTDKILRLLVERDYDFIRRY